MEKLYAPFISEGTYDSSLIFFHPGVQRTKLPVMILFWLRISCRGSLIHARGSCIEIHCSVTEYLRRWPGLKCRSCILPKCAWNQNSISTLSWWIIRAYACSGGAKELWELGSYYMLMKWKLIINAALLLVSFWIIAQSMTALGQESWTNNTVPSLLRVVPGAGGHKEWHSWNWL